MKAVAEVIGVSRSNLAEYLRQYPQRRIGRPPLPTSSLRPRSRRRSPRCRPNGYRRVHAILKRQALAAA